MKSITNCKGLGTLGLSKQQMTIGQSKNKLFKGELSEDDGFILMTDAVPKLTEEYVKGAIEASEKHPKMANSEFFKRFKREFDNWEELEHVPEELTGFTIDEYVERVKNGHLSIDAKLVPLSRLEICLEVSKAEGAKDFYEKFKDKIYDIDTDTCGVELYQKAVIELDRLCEEANIPRRLLTAVKNLT